METIADDHRILKKIARKPNIDKMDVQIKKVMNNGPSPNDSAPILLRVKRPKDADDLDQIYLEYDKDGAFKRTKMVTEKDAI